MDCCSNFTAPESVWPVSLAAYRLLLALFAFQMLPVNFAGAALLLLGAGMLVAEAMMPSFGVIGIGGVVAFVIGSIFLLDTDFQPFRIALPLVAAVTVVSALFLSVALGLVWRGRRQPVVSGQEAIVGAEARALEAFEGKGQVLMDGESWEARSRRPAHLNAARSPVVPRWKGWYSWRTGCGRNTKRNRKMEQMLGNGCLLVTWPSWILVSSGGYADVPRIAGIRTRCGFSAGTVLSVKGPGLVIVFPGVQQMVRVSLRTVM